MFDTAKLTSASDPVKENWPLDAKTNFIKLLIFSLKFNLRSVASHFMEFSGVSAPKSDLMMAALAAMFRVFESPQVPQNSFPFAWNLLLKPLVPEGGGGAVEEDEEGIDEEELIVLEGGRVLEEVTVPGRHWK